MDENRIPEFLCDLIGGGNPGVPIVPETWRESAASLWLTGGGIEKTYVDGSCLMAVPFEIRLRCHGRTVDDRLDALTFFSTVGNIIASSQTSSRADIRVLSGASKSAIYENGEEEYRASYVLRYYKPN